MKVERGSYKEQIDHSHTSNMSPNLQEDKRYPPRNLEMFE